jgi:hypothetical protein
MNIVTIPAQFITKTLEEIRFSPSKACGDNQWYKIVIMDVEVDHLRYFYSSLKISMQKVKLK